MATSSRPKCFKIDFNNYKMYYNSKDLMDYSNTCLIGSIFIPVQLLFL